ncbi:MAG: serine/threonine protein kinase [Lentisphaeraceae bacterium]|nr:serine/threonine protein kinase [Lentisphaeraceae bacterium]
MSELENNDFLANYLNGIVDEVNEEASAEESEFQTFIQAFSDIDKKYSDKEFIARGGMKNIFRVRENHTLRNVAMAQLFDGEKDRSKIISFLREARITALLEHPNIVPIHEINQKDGNPYFTMKEIQGLTLGEILKKLKGNSHKVKKKYDLNTLLNIFIKVCDAISYAHSRNIVHLDLKPDNIHVGEFGEVLVIDWGLAKEVTTDKESLAYSETLNFDTSHTMDGFVKGTIGYMAPEQARGENSEKDFLTDIYALGSILYSILSYKPPYEHKNLKQAISLTALGQYTPLPNEKDLPRALVSVSGRAMQLHKKDRYNSVEELKNDVQLYLNGFATKAEDANFTDLAILFYKRNKALCTLTTTFTLISFIVTYFFIISITKSEAIAKKNAELAVENAIEAQKREKEARKLYLDLTDTIQEKEVLTSTSIPLVLDKAYYMRRHQFNFQESYNILNEVYDHDIKDPDYWTLFAYHMIGEFKFNDAIKYFGMAKPGNDEKLAKNISIGLNIAQKFRNRKKTLPNLKLVLKELPKIQKQIVAGHIMFNVFTHWGLSKNQKIETLKYALKTFNPQVKNWNVTISVSKRQNDKFNIGLEGHKELTDLNSLSGLQIDKLSLKGCTSISSLVCLKTCNIKTLNLSSTDANKLKYRQNIYNVMINSVEELIMKDMNLRHLRLTGKQSLKLLDLSGSQVNSQNISNQNVKDLNFCQATVEDQQYLRRFISLQRVIIPEDKVNKPLLKYWQSKKVKITKCNCTNKRICRFKK